MPQSAVNAEPLIVTIERQRIRGIGLQFHRVGAASFGGMDEFQCLSVILPMVRRQFGDHIDRRSRPNAPAGDFNVG